MKDTIIGSIYCTNDYSKFKKLEHNRTVLKKRKENLINSFNIHEVMNPICVNEKYEIIDGQGRYEAKKELGLPIYYIIDANATIDDCRRMNEYNAPWTSMDFVRSYAEDGNENFIRLLSFIEETKQPIERTLRLANIGTKDSENYSVIKTGKLIFTEEHIKVVKNVIKKAEEISIALCRTKRLNDAFYRGVKVMVEYEGYIHERMLRNCANQRATYNQMSNLESQLKEFSRIYNHGIKKNKLYFEDYMRNKGYNTRSYEYNNFEQGEDVSSLGVNNEK